MACHGQLYKGDLAIHIVYLYTHWMAYQFTPHLREMFSHQEAEQARNFTNWVLHPLVLVRAYETTNLINVHHDLPQGGYPIAFGMANGISFHEWGKIINRFTNSRHFIPFRWIRMHEASTPQPLGPSLPAGVIVREDASYAIAPLLNGQQILNASTCLDNCLAAQTPQYFAPIGSECHVSECHVIAMLPANLIGVDSQTPSDIIAQRLHGWIAARTTDKRRRLSLASIVRPFTSQKLPPLEVEQHTMYGNIGASDNRRAALANWLAQRNAEPINLHPFQLERWEEMQKLPEGVKPPALSLKVGFNITDSAQRNHFYRFAAFAMCGNYEKHKNKPDKFLKALKLDEAISRAMAYSLDTPSKG